MVRIELFNLNFKKAVDGIVDFEMMTLVSGYEGLETVWSIYFLHRTISAN